MDIFKYVVAVIPSVIFIILGVCIKYFKTYWLISGYNMMSAEKKKDVDVEGLGKTMGNFCFVMAGLILAFILSLFLEQTTLSIIAAVMFAVSIIYFIIKSQKFSSNVVKSKGKLDIRTKIYVSIIAAFIVVVFSGLGILLYKSTQPTTYNVLNDRIEIKGLYGETIKFNDISNISLSDQIPDITARTNGSAIGSMLKGYFTVDQMGKAKLFIDTKTPSFIIIETNDKTVILNGSDKASTQKLFTSLEDLIK